MDNRVMRDPVLDLYSVPAEPLFWLWSGDEPPISTAMYGWREARLTVRTVRGHKMLDEAQLFDEFAAAWQFPTHFGENWDALSDCLTDLDWLPPEAGYVLVINQSQRVLEHAPDRLTVLVRSLASACAEWRDPVALGEWWDRPAVPFHTVLAISRDEVTQVRSRWEAAGAVLSDLAS